MCFKKTKNGNDLIDDKYSFVRSIVNTKVEKESEGQKILGIIFLFTENVFFCTMFRL